MRAPQRGTFVVLASVLALTIAIILILLSQKGASQGVLGGRDIGISDVVRLVSGVTAVASYEDEAPRARVLGVAIRDLRA
jgi:hypothetical protein